ncbi:MAG TPA: hypothetical protein VMH90_00460 [Thermoplasmata archaeon]|nr:hypothetical protein [Thermoplasmata archaeon]
MGLPMGWGPPPTPVPVDPGPPVRAVRSGVELYRWVAALGVIGQVLGLAIALADPSVGRLASLSSTGGISLSSTAPGFTGPALLLLLGSGLIGFLAFILSIVAFVRWRSGVIELRRSAVPPGPFEAPRLTGAAAKAEGGYRRALWTMLIWLLTVIAGGVVIAVVLVSSLGLMTNSNGTAVAPTPSQVNHAVGSVVGYALALGGILLVIELVLAYFVTESLEGFLETGPARPSPYDLGNVRGLVYLGMALGVATLLNTWVLGAGAIAIAGPLLLFVACTRYLTAFDERLGGHVPTPYR